MSEVKTIRIDPAVHQRLLYYKVAWQKKNLSEVIAAALETSEVHPRGSHPQAEGHPAD